VRGYAGDSEGAIESLNRAMRLNPLDPLVFLTQSAMAFAHFIAGRDDTAAEWAAMALRVKPHWLPALRVSVAANAWRGRRDEAQRAFGQYLAIDPQVRIAKVGEFYPLRREVDRQRLVEGMRMAGMRE
jgi:tetratricopeptide (TPR) repeat protein